MQVYETEVLYLPDDASLRYLPEGPIQQNASQFSWVAIQDGPEAGQGSFNLFDLSSQENRTWPLSGRPGFAFPTQDPAVMVVGLSGASNCSTCRLGDSRYQRRGGCRRHRDHY